ASFLLVAASGCTISNVNDTMRRAEDASESAEGLAASMRSRQDTPARPTVRYSDTPWVSTRPINLKIDGIPDALNCDITYSPTADVDIFQVGQEITKWCGIPVRVTPDVTLTGSSASSFSLPPLGEQQGSAANPGGAMGLPPLPALPQGGSALGASSGGRNLSISGLKWKGKAADVCSRHRCNRQAGSRAWLNYGRRRRCSGYRSGCRTAHRRRHSRRRRRSHRRLLRDEETRMSSNGQYRHRRCNQN
ncbi:unnamed protein product, partial [marine sediment metagenome]